MSPRKRSEVVDEERWCAERREQVAGYLRAEGVDHGRIGEWPAWHLTPYVSIWAVESLKHPNSVGWWVICGDLPTDYVSARGIRHPRAALAAIAERWLEAAAYMAKGKLHPTMQIGAPETWHDLAPLLRSRASLLRDWSADDAIWAGFDH